MTTRKIVFIFVLLFCVALLFTIALTQMSHEQMMSALVICGSVLGIVGIIWAIIELVDG